MRRNVNQRAKPVSARLLDVGGLALFWGFKALIVLTVAVALLTAASLVREGHRSASPSGFA